MQMLHAHMQDLHRATGSMTPVLAGRSAPVLAIRNAPPHTFSWHPSCFYTGNDHVQGGSDHEEKNPERFCRARSGSSTGSSGVLVCQRRWRRRYGRRCRYGRRWRPGKRDPEFNTDTDQRSDQDPEQRSSPGWNRYRLRKCKQEGQRVWTG